MQLYNNYKTLNIIFVFIFLFLRLTGQGIYNHPELDWQTFETEHFKIHFHNGTEGSAREGGIVAESIYDHVTGLYEFEPSEKTHLVFLDTDDYSNGAAYFYDNKIFIWASPLQFHLRGNHRWLQNVITHEFVHIVSLQKSMKFGRMIPGMFLQYMGYEKEKRKDVLYGYPNTLISYPVPGTAMPPWMAEGIAQYMYLGATFDSWDSHRDMVLRDHVLNKTVFSFAEMNTFGKKGIGNESTYNSGYALVLYIASKYGEKKLMELSRDLSRIKSYSINQSIKRVLGITGKQLHADFVNTLEKRYDLLLGDKKENYHKGNIIIHEGTSNLYPQWSPDGKSIAYISNKKNDYFGQTDLFIYNILTGDETKVASNVTSAPDWNHDGSALLFSALPKYPDKNGSRYYDLYIYFPDTEKTEQLTNGLRAYAPNWAGDSTRVAYLATFDGTQNAYMIDLETKERTKITDFSNREILSGLDFDRSNDRLIYDITTNHFSDIGFVSLGDSSTGNILSNEYWDERHGSAGNNHFIYSDDRSGIFNLYYINEENGKQGYITNVSGGAFMPDINSKGQVVYSIYENGGYKIALLDTVEVIDSKLVGYSQEYYRKNFYLEEAITNGDTIEAVSYHDQIPPLFIMPRVMVDYGTVKPGVYFYSSEIIERASVIGAASINFLGDLDSYFQFELKRFYPTLYVDVMYATRNIRENSLYRVYELDDKLKFRFIGLKTGAKVPIRGQVLNLFGALEVARAFVKQSIPQKNLEGGIAYDYYRGFTGGFSFNFDGMKPAWNQNINPGQGFRLFSQLQYEKNYFISGLDLSDAGTIVESFDKNDGIRVQVDGRVHFTLPWAENITTSLNLQNGYFSNTEVDSFFHFFGGGMPGLKGFPYYSIQGTNLVIGTGVVRLPLMVGKHIPLGWFTLQNSTLGLVIQGGDAWINETEFKSSAGIEVRFNGFSFYNYPTAIGFEIHKGLTKFDVTSDGETWTVGHTPRIYFTLLFDF